MKIVGTLLTRNGEDIIEEWLDHHLNNGISELIVTDNGSEDGTKSYLNIPEIIKVIDEPGRKYDQDIWVTRMAYEAAKRNPDWIVHIDNDEFWSGFHHLESLAEDVYVVVSGLWHVHIPNRHVIGKFKQSAMPLTFEIEDVTFGEPRVWSTARKVIHKPFPNMKIDSGNHRVFNFPGKVVTLDGIEIHHYPIRSFEQFKHKVVMGGELMSNSNCPDSTNSHWRRWFEAYQEGKLKEVYDDMIRSAYSRKRMYL
jgi:hypothetical protein